MSRRKEAARARAAFCAEAGISPNHVMFGPASLSASAGGVVLVRGGTITPKDIERIMRALGRERRPTSTTIDYVEDVTVTMAWGVAAQREFDALMAFVGQSGTRATYEAMASALALVRPRGDFKFVELGTYGQLRVLPGKQAPFAYPHTKLPFHNMPPCPHPSHKTAQGKP